MTKEVLQAPSFRAREHREILHNAKVKIFPRVGVYKVTYSDKPVFAEHGWEAVNPQKREVYERGKMGEDVRDDSLRRAKQRVFEYAMLNSFDYFITMTLDKEKINRYDPEEIAAKLQRFLKDKVRHKGLKYIIVPELHKDGAVHMHGLVSGKLKLVNSGRLDGKGRTIFNVTDWKYGFTTAVRIDGDYEKACYYITKYIQKVGKMIFGNFYYAGGHGLIRQPETHLFDAEFEGIEGKEYFVEAANNSFKYEDKREEITSNDGE